MWSYMTAGSSSSHRASLWEKLRRQHDDDDGGELLDALSVLASGGSWLERVPEGHLAAYRNLYFNLQRRRANPTKGSSSSGRSGSSGSGSGSPETITWGDYVVVNAAAAAAADDQKKSTEAAKTASEEESSGGTGGENDSGGGDGHGAEQQDDKQQDNDRDKQQDEQQDAQATRMRLDARRSWSHLTSSGLRSAWMQSVWRVEREALLGDVLAALDCLAQPPGYQQGMNYVAAVFLLDLFDRGDLIARNVGAIGIGGIGGSGGDATQAESERSAAAFSTTTTTTTTTTMTTTTTTGSSAAAAAVATSSFAADAFVLLAYSLQVLGLAACYPARQRQCQELLLPASPPSPPSSPSLPPSGGLETLCRSFEAVFRLQKPELFRHLHDPQEGQMPGGAMLYLVPWFTTLFATSVAPELVGPIVDLFLLSPDALFENALFRVALALLTVAEGALLSAPCLNDDAPPAGGGGGGGGGCLDVPEALSHFKAVIRSLEPELVLLAALRIKIVEPAAPSLSSSSSSSSSSSPPPSADYLHLVFAGGEPMPDPSKLKMATTKKEKENYLSFPVAPLGAVTGVPPGGESDL